MNWKYIFNPFLKYSERNLLIVGLLSILVGSIIASYFSVTFDGIISVHQKDMTLLDSLKENVINVLIVFILLLILGKIINPKTRFIDILNIAMNYRIPLYLTAPLISLPLFDNISRQVLENKDRLENLKFDTLELAAILAVSSVLMIALIYSIVLLVNGFRTATNLKKWQYYVAFATVIIIGEVIAQFIISNL